MPIHPRKFFEMFLFFIFCTFSLFSYSALIDEWDGLALEEVLRLQNISTQPGQALPVPETPLDTTKSQGAILEENPPCNHTLLEGKAERHCRTSAPPSISP